MKKTNKEKVIKNNNGCGYLYFYIHMITEIVCFYYLTVVTNNSILVWLVPLLYDGIAFMPQSIYGYLNDKKVKMSLSYPGMLLLALGIIVYFYFKTSIFVSLLLITIGNGFIHVNGAEVTLKNSNGKLAPAAIFVAGGSIGVVAGKLLGSINISPILILIMIASSIPFIMLANTYDGSFKEANLKKYDYARKDLNPYLVIVLAVFVVIVRGYMGYGIPTSWNKTTIQLIIFYVIMCLGKALGGILCDKFGIRKVAILSTLLAIPFLCIGDNLMIVSLIGVMFFSMTMSITLGILVSVLKKNPGLAFGLTTIGLFLGTVPIFFVKINNLYINISLIIITSIICCLILNFILKKEDK